MACVSYRWCMSYKFYMSYEQYRCRMDRIGRIDGVCYISRISHVGNIHYLLITTPNIIMSFQDEDNFEQSQKSVYKPLPGAENTSTGGRQPVGKCHLCIHL